MEFKKWIKDGTNRQWLWWPCCPGFHHARAVRLSGDLPIPLGKVVCESGDLWAVILFYINLVVSTTCKIWEIKVVGGSAWAPRHRRRRRTLYQSSTTSKRWSPIQVFIFAGGLLYQHLTHHCPFSSDHRQVIRSCQRLLGASPLKKEYTPPGTSITCAIASWKSSRSVNWTRLPRMPPFVGTLSSKRRVWGGGCTMHPIGCWSDPLGRLGGRLVQKRGLAVRRE